MTPIRLLTAALLALTLVTSPSSAAPLTLSELLGLTEEGVGEVVLLSIARNQGVAGPLTAQQILEMKQAGWTDVLMAAVIDASSTPTDAAATQPASLAPTPGSEVVYEERDGAVVARLRGEPEAAREPGLPRFLSEIPPAPALPAAPVVIVQAPAAAAAPTAASVQHQSGYPVGADFGWSGSAVFLPAHFGGSTPSAFGRAIISNGADRGYYGTPYAAPLAPYGYSGARLNYSVRPSTTLIRTSRGTRRIPN